jgi:hypothetical protein
MNAPSIQASISGIHFFVGAGASHRISNQHDPDFPLGSHLFESFKQKIITDAETGQLPDVRKAWAIKNFSNHNSIDDFLKTARDNELTDLVELGRTFVDQEISSCEYKLSEHFKRHNRKLIAPWIKSLLDFMTQDTESYEEAYLRLKFVNDNNSTSYPALNFATLNYDRVIEFSLLNYFVDKYPKSEDDINKDFQMGGNLVQHHHGSLGALNEREFGQTKSEDSPKLKFWFEMSEEPQSWPIMNAAINARSHSVFLGFGFHESITRRFECHGKSPKLYISKFNCDPQLEEEIGNFQTKHKLENPIITMGRDCCPELIRELIKECSK